MNVCTYTDLRDHLRERLDQVHDTRTPLLVTRQNAPSAILIDKEEFDGIMASLHLLRSPGLFFFQWRPASLPALGAKRRKRSAFGFAETPARRPVPL